MTLSNLKPSSTKLLRDVEELKTRLSESESPVNNNEVWSLQQTFQVTCGQLLVLHQEIALEKGIERDLWNIGFRTTITQLQSQMKDRKKLCSEAKDLLNWFLSAASGFYLQLLNQICSINSLDLTFRRKDSVYGLVGGGLSSIINVKTKDSVTKNALYLCQYCLIHLGDLARYRHQAKQAETYYRHAVSVAATSGHPYNQLALLEAGRGNRLASVFLYIRALCVAAPFPGAPSNLTQTMSKVLSNRSKDDNKITYSEVKIGTLTRMTKDEYINLFLHFHSSLLLKGDSEAAKVDLPRLSSALSMLVATTAFTRSSLVQIFAVNIFSFHYFSGRFTIRVTEESKKEEEKLIDPKECESALDLIEELIVGTLAALLLPVHTMKEPEIVLTYPALPTIRLMFEWIFLEGKLSCPALKKKQQIWPGLCALVNYLQQPLKAFESEKYSDTPLPEDWELQEFQPLQKILGKFRYRESSPRLSPEQYSLLRAKRFSDLAQKFCYEILDDGAVVKSTMEEGITKFESTSNLKPPVEEVLDLERLTLQPKEETSVNMAMKKKEKVGILKPQGSLERSKTSPKEKPQSNSVPHLHQGTTQILKDPTRETDKKQPVTAGKDKRTTLFVDHPKIDQSLHPPPTIIAKPKSTRTNVALQAILKRNSNAQETKQVTFQTPTPSASPNPSDASYESQRSQISPPPLSMPNTHFNSPSPLVTSNPGGIHPPPPPPPVQMPPPNQNYSFNQRFSIPFRDIDRSTQPPSISAVPNSPYPIVSGTGNFSSSLNTGITNKSISPRNDQLPYMGTRLSIPNGTSTSASNTAPELSPGSSAPHVPPSKGMFGTTLDDDNRGYYPSHPQGIGMLQAPQNQSIFNKMSFNSQNQSNALFAKNNPPPINWKTQSQLSTDSGIGSRGLQMMSSGFGDMYNSPQRSLDHTFNKEKQQEFPSSQNFSFPYQSFPVNPSKEAPPSLGMLLDSNNARNHRGIGNPNNSPMANIPNQLKNLMQLPGGELGSGASVGVGPNLPSNIYSGNIGPSNPWWGKENNNSMRNNASFPFSQMGTRPPFQKGNGSPPCAESGLPKTSNTYQNPNMRAPSGTSGFSLDSSSNEGNANSMRMSNTYSLFGPLGGVGRDSLQQSFPHNSRLSNPAINSPHQQSQQQQQQQQQQSHQPLQHQQPQFPHHSLWSGPSPLQRLLEQKKFSTK